MIGLQIQHSPNTYKIKPNKELKYGLLQFIKHSQDYRKSYEKFECKGLDR